MKAARLDLYIQQGARYELTFTWLDKAGNPVDLTNRVGKGQIRPSANSDIVYAEIDVTVLSGPQGQVRLRLTTAQTAEIPTKGRTFTDTTKHVYDIKFPDSDGVEDDRVLNGYAIISPGVTR